MDWIWIGITAVVIALVLFCLMGVAPARNCPNCGSPLPSRRKPKSLRQLLWGGWTCPACACEVDRLGRRAGDSRAA